MKEVARMPNSLDALERPVVPKEIPDKVRRRFEQIRRRVNCEFKEYPVELSLMVYNQSEDTKWWLLTIRTREFTGPVLAVIKDETRTFPKEDFSFFPSFDQPKNEPPSKE